MTEARQFTQEDFDRAIAALERWREGPYILMPSKWHPIRRRRVVQRWRESADALFLDFTETK